MKKDDDNADDDDDEDEDEKVKRKKKNKEWRERRSSSNSQVSLWAVIDLGDGQFLEQCDVDGSFFNSDAIPIIFGKA